MVDGVCKISQLKWQFKYLSTNSSKGVPLNYSTIRVEILRSSYKLKFFILVHINYLCVSQSQINVGKQSTTKEHDLLYRSFDTLI